MEALRVWPAIPGAYNNQPVKMPASRLQSGDRLDLKNGFSARVVRNKNGEIFGEVCDFGLVPSRVFRVIEVEEIFRAVYVQGEGQVSRIVEED